jgi:hypothetical protein
VTIPRILCRAGAQGSGPVRGISLNDFPGFEPLTGNLPLAGEKKDELF